MKNNATTSSSASKLTAVLSSISFRHNPLLSVLLSLLAVVIATVYNTPWFLHTTVCAGLSVLSFCFCYNVIPRFGVHLKQRGLSGRDLNKTSPVDIPESLGMVSAVMFIICAVVCQMLFSDDPEKLLEYSSGLLAVCCMTFLGFTDDVLDLRWRYKMILPLAAALPLIVSYRGPSTVLVPWPMRNYLGADGLIELGLGLYGVAGVMLLIFSAITGINGLEVGQSLVMSAAVISHNLLEVVGHHGRSEDMPGHITHHFFSLLFSLPFFSTSLALFCYNWYPAKVFVGDSYTYFAGSYFAVVGILGHFSKTLLVFFIPQIINLVVSLPQVSRSSNQLGPIMIRQQLVGILPCPRHRLPVYDNKTGKLLPSPNLTVLNLMLHITGPLEENKLCCLLLQFQACCCGLGLFLRYTLFKTN